MPNTKLIAIGMRLPPDLAVDERGFEPAGLNLSQGRDLADQLFRACDALAWKQTVSQTGLNTWAPCT